MLKHKHILRNIFIYTILQLLLTVTSFKCNVYCPICKWTLNRYEDDDDDHAVTAYVTLGLYDVNRRSLRSIFVFCVNSWVLVVLLGLFFEFYCRCIAVLNR